MAVRTRLLGACLLVAAILSAASWIPAAEQERSTGPAASLQKVAEQAGVDWEISFNRDIRPILSDKCFACHGPDAAVAVDSGGFRLDLFEEATKPAPSGDTPIVPGDSNASSIITRITHTKPNLVMPPPSAKISVTDDEVTLLRRWIDEGAQYEGHWAYQTPTKPVLPEVNDANEAWVMNNIDRFIAARLERANLSPSEQADKPTLIRRVSLDLTGLPPTPDEIDAFLADTSADAYEKLVDRLLGSPHFGERMALIWLDASRYADTIGYQLDHSRSSWPYRDYIINAFNKNKPFDQFLIEQLAGDMLPNPTDEQLVATAFCRMHMMNHEGGSINEEFRVTAVADRIETIATVFMAQTYNCAMCHDHKYDPTTQQDYFNLFKYFHSINERGIWTNKPERAIAYGDRVTWYTPELRLALTQAEAKLKQAKQARQNATPELEAQQRAWEQALRDEHAVKWKAAELIDAKTTQKSGTLEFKPDGSVLLSNRDSPPQENLTLTFRTHATDLRLIKLDALTDPWNGNRIGRGDAGNAQPTHIKISVASLKGHSQKQQVRLKTAWATQSNQDKNKQELGPMNLLKPGSPGWSTGGKEDKNPRTLLLVADEPFGFEGGSEIEVLIEHRAGRRQTLGRVRLGFASADPTVLGVFPGHGTADKKADIRLAPLGLIEPARRTTHGSEALITQWGQNRSPKYAELSKAVEMAEQTLNKIKAQGAPITVMKELPEPKPMYVLSRGAYDKPMKDRPAELELPSFIGLPLPEGVPNNRLGFAKWLVHPDHPLTARVHVNRLWQMVFGTGIVATVEDFGSQAEWPSHPELLDYLGITLIESGWDQKALLKQIVMSSTYRQQATRNLDAAEVDAGNRLLSYFPRKRLPGEFIRDHALAASGLLNDTIGGPSVKPYQPGGLWREVSMGPRSNTNVFKRDEGDKLYRRSIYTFIKRKSPPPQMQTFGAPNRESCTVDRGVTNTPLQALVLWNDEQFLEAARALAQRAIAEVDDDDQRIVLIVRRCTGETPNAEAIEVIKEALQYYRKRFAESPDDANALLQQGELPLPVDYDAVELASWMMIGNTILSLDETIVRD
ncbi:MAG: PSD1 and planctomycete cytochrome C domain-containing protein [Planctomycetota bacterium]